MVKSEAARPYPRRVVLTVRPAFPARPGPPGFAVDHPGAGGDGDRLC